MRLSGVVGVALVVAGSGLIGAVPAGAAVADVSALRAEVGRLNKTSGHATIELAAGTTYKLPGASGCANEDANAAGDLDITRAQPVTIAAPDGQPPAVLEMTCESQRVIEVTKTSLTLRNVVIRNGRAPDFVAGRGGGGVRVSGNVTLQKAAFENNRAGFGSSSGTADTNVGGGGGAVFAAGTVTIEDSRFTGNRAGHGNAAEASTVCGTKRRVDGAAGGSGGAVYARGGLTVVNSTFTGNRAGNGGKGGCKNGVPGYGGVGGAGGAIACYGECVGSITIRGSTFSENAAGNGGDTGANFAYDGSGADGVAGGSGGAIYFVGTAGKQSLLVENSTFDRNTAGNGGAGGYANGSPPRGGEGGYSGAIWADFDPDNDSSAVAVTLTHVTATENGGGAGGGPGEAAGSNGKREQGTTGPQRGGSVAVSHAPWTSVASVIGTSLPDTDGPDCWTKARNPLYSWSTDYEDGCGFGAGSVQPMAGYALGQLGSYGGPTLVRLPASTSILLDKASASPATIDQRGVARPQNATADVGAVERQPSDPAVTVPVVNATPVADSPADVRVWIIGLGIGLVVLVWLGIRLVKVKPIQRRVVVNEANVKVQRGLFGISRRKR